MVHSQGLTSRCSLGAWAPPQGPLLTVLGDPGVQCGDWLSPGVQDTKAEAFCDCRKSHAPVLQYCVGPTGQPGSLWEGTALECG